MPNSHDNIPSILSKNLCVLRGLCGECVTAIPARSTSPGWSRRPAEDPALAPVS